MMVGIRDDDEGSLCNLALNGMNIDELKNVISVEESQLLRDPSSSSSSSSPPALVFRSSWNETADEIWKEIMCQENNNNKAMEMNRSSNIIHHHQPIVAVDPMVAVSQQADWMQQEMGLFDPMVVGYSENQLPLPMSMPIPIPIPIPEMSTTTASSESQVVAKEKRKYSDEMMEKSFERKQKRMIKNRESAARSRASKQAYTNRLEHQVFLSRKTNSWLKKLKELEMILSSDLTPIPRYQLRRTSSVSF